VSPAVSKPDGERAVRAVPAVPAVRAHARRLVAAGATLGGERDDPIRRRIVLTDPKGHEPCLQ